MATGKSNKQTTADDEVLDAPKLPADDSRAPGSESLSEDQDVAAQAQPMDEHETASTPPADEVDFVVTLDIPNVPKAGEYELREGQHDPSLVAIPGLGQFQNGTTTAISAEQLHHMAEHYRVSGVSGESHLPVGVTIEEKGK